MILQLGIGQQVQAIGIIELVEHKRVLQVLQVTHLILSQPTIIIIGTKNKTNIKVLEFSLTLFVLLQYIFYNDIIS